MVITRFYRTSQLWNEELLVSKIQAHLPNVLIIDREVCYYIESSQELTQRELDALDHLLNEISECDLVTRKPVFSGRVYEFGTRLSRVTPESTNAVALCRSSGLGVITRLEQSIRYAEFGEPEITLGEEKILISLLHDRMTEERYPEPLQSFGTPVTPEPVQVIPTLFEGINAVREYSVKVGLGLPDSAIEYLVKLSKELRRDLTNVEIYNFATLNSDHSRHTTFALTKWKRDGVELPLTLMDMIRQMQKRHPGLTLSAFSDNAAVIQGFATMSFEPEVPGQPSAFILRLRHKHIAYKAETHNHPCAISPYDGGETCVGGLLRDLFSVGLGGDLLAIVTQYCTSHMKLPGKYRPWLFTRTHSKRLQSALRILIEASKGNSDYANQIGVPLIAGTCREFRLDIRGEKFGFDKPWVAGGGFASVDAEQVFKHEQKKDDLIVQLGGDAFAIGFGGATAASQAAGSRSAQLDFSSVQRGDAQMEQPIWRVIRACIARDPCNPIVDIQDLGAGGDCSAVPELIRRLGGKVQLRSIPSGDASLSTLVLWCNEAQERVVLVIHPTDLEWLHEVAVREHCPFAVIGKVDGSGKLVVEDSLAPVDNYTERFPVDLPMEALLGKLPIEVKDLTPQARELFPLRIPKNLSFQMLLQRILSLSSVCSKSFLVNKVDRSVGGKVMQQPVVGSLQLPLANVGVMALGFDDPVGKAMALGEQPISWLVNSAASVRMSVAEALTNLVSVRILSLSAVSLSGNWGVACKAPGETYRLYQAVEALGLFLDKLGISPNVGKDSTSMEVTFTAGGKQQRVISPGMFTATAYAPVPDVACKVTPDIKLPGKTKLMFIDLARGKRRLGASAFAQVIGQVGNEVPDVEDSALLKQGFQAVQKLIKRNIILSLHDISDGGLLITALEMAFSGDCGITLNLTGPSDILGFFGTCFAQELGWVMEYELKNEQIIEGILRRAGLAGCIHRIGLTTSERNILVTYNREVKFRESMPEVRDWWHETSYRIDSVQANPKTALEEREALRNSEELSYHLSFTPRPTPKRLLQGRRPCVAILRAHGTNGDLEMARVFELAGFEPWDVTMSDLMAGKVKLTNFQGLVFCGGFSFKDVFGSGKGWAHIFKYNTCLKFQLHAFTTRSDTFVLGVCNGFQVMSQLGLFTEFGFNVRQPRLLQNKVGRFDSHNVMLKVEASPSIFFQGMEGSVLGVPIAHGEGRLHFPESESLPYAFENHLVPLRYVDGTHQPTERYPFNPNGSSGAIAALTSAHGRFLGIMPHPERAFQPRQWHYWPPEWKKKDTSPWLQMFINTREWCQKNK